AVTINPQNSSIITVMTNHPAQPQLPYQPIIAITLLVLVYPGGVAKGMGIGPLPAEPKVPSHLVCPWLSGVVLARLARHVVLAPGVQGVVDKAAALQQHLVVRLGIESSFADSEQPGPDRVGLQVTWDISGMDDLGEADESRIAVQVEIVDE